MSGQAGPSQPPADNNRRDKRPRERDSDSEDDPNKRPKIEDAEYDATPSPPANRRRRNPPSFTPPSQRTRLTAEATMTGPLVHPDPNRFPRRFMVDTPNTLNKFPIDDEVYEIKDYLIKYEDFGLRKPTRDTQLRRANADLLPETISSLLRLRSEQSSIHACLNCDKWFSRDNEDCNEQFCYFPYRDELAQWAVDNVSVHKTPGSAQGYGAYMRPGCKARKGQYLGIYYGVLVGPDGEDVPDSAYIYSMNSHNGESEYNIDSGMYGNWTRFANSHCNPNVECCPEQIGGIRVLAFSALRTIRENEQILINYGKRYFDELNLLCTCDAFPTPHKTLGHTQRRQNRPGRPPQVDEDEDEEDGESPSSPSSVRSHITVVGPPSEDEEEEEEEDEEDDPLNPMSRYGRRENDLPAYIPRPATKFASGRSFVSGVQNALHNQEVIEVADGVEALNSDEDMEDADEGDEDEDMEDV